LQTDKDAIVIPIAQSRGKHPRETVASGTKVTDDDLIDKTLIIDLLELKRTINIKGSLPEESSESSGDKRDILDILQRQGGVVRVIRGSGDFQQVFTANFVKVLFTESPGTVMTEKQSVAATETTSISVIINMVIGENR